MRSPISRLKSLSPASILWFVTPLITFSLTVASTDLYIVLILLSPLIGCLSLSWWLCRSTTFPGLSTLLKAELARFLYIFCVAFIFTFLSLQSDSYFGLYRTIVGLITSSSMFLLFSVFLYLIPDVLIALSAFGVRRKYKLPLHKAAFLLFSLLGAAGYAVTLRLLGITFGLSGD